MKPKKLFNSQDLAEAKSLGFVQNDTHNIFAVKKNGLIYLYRNSCPHLGIELEWLEHQFLDNQGELIQCSTHGALFIIESGECVAGPCLGQRLTAISFTMDSKGDIYI